MDDIFTDYPLSWKSILLTVPGVYDEGAEKEAALLADILTQGAADIIHLRKPEASREYMERLLHALPSSLRGRIMLHDYYELAEKYGLRGVQLNSRHPIEEGGFGLCSASCHSVKEAKEKALNKDYVTLSPVFHSISKPGYTSPFSLEELKGQLPEGKVIALGGVTPKDFHRLRRIGFGGSALLGWFWENSTPERVRALALRVRMLKAFPLLLITDSPTVEGTIDQAVRAYEGGCRWVQVRMKEASSRERVSAAKEILARCPGMLVCIDDDCEAVALSGAHGVHLGKNDISTREARKIIGEDAIVGRTANSWPDVEQIALEGGADYLGIGPFRFTSTKKNLAPSLGLDGYRDLIARMRSYDIHLPVLAIGGITPEDVYELIKTGVDGIAVSGAINKAASPIEATELFLKELKKKI